MKSTVLLLSKDVFFWPVVRQAASSVGCEAVMARSADDPKMGDLQAGDVFCCLIDLASFPVAQIADVVSFLHERLGADVRLVAFGPHVQEARLAAAAQAGCSPVLSRGQVNSKLPEYLQAWVQ